MPVVRLVALGLLAVVVVDFGDLAALGVLAVLVALLAFAVDFLVAALAANSSSACSKVMLSAVVPSGKEAFTLPCFT